MEVRPTVVRGWLWRNSKRLLWIQSPAKPERERDREKGGGRKKVADEVYV